MHSKTGWAFKGLPPEMSFAAFRVLFFHVEGRNLEVPLDRLRPLPAPAAPWLDFGLGFAVSLPATMKADRSGLEGILFKRLIYFHEWTRFFVGRELPLGVTMLIHLSVRLKQLGHTKRSRAPSETCL